MCECASWWAGCIHMYVVADECVRVSPYRCRWGAHHRWSPPTAAPTAPPPSHWYPAHCWRRGPTTSHRSARHRTATIAALSGRAIRVLQLSVICAVTITAVHNTCGGHCPGLVSPAPATVGPTAPSRLGFPTAVPTTPTCAHQHPDTLLHTPAQFHSCTYTHNDAHSHRGNWRCSL